MRITGVQISVVDVGRGFRWGGRRDREVIGVLLVLETDTEHRGISLCWPSDLPAQAVAVGLETAAKPRLMGASPFDRPRILAPLWRGFRVGLPLAVIGAADVALWDLAGKAAGLPIADLLGRTRDRVKACASAPPCESAEDCGPLLEPILAEGFRAVKLHVCGDLATDIAVCTEARHRAGDGVDLMMDAMGLYDRSMALALGRVLDDLGFRWFEDPLRDDDLEGWSRLRSAIDTPLAGVDSVRFTARDYAQQIGQGPFDILRMDAARHGITQLRELAVLADAAGLACEGHSFGPALAQAANLQVALSISNSAYCELPVPIGGLDFGVETGLRLDADGYVSGPTGPGLGMTLDCDALSEGVPARSGN